MGQFQSDKAHCKRGHEFTPENTKLNAKGERNCRACLLGRRKWDYALVRERYPEKGIWRNMINRCENPKHNRYHIYWAKGVSVCAAWRKSFKQFIADMGPRPSAEHSIDRFPDKNGNYEPGNCRWATIEEQSNNRNDNVLVTVDGETKTIAEWSRITGIGYSSLHNRISVGWDHAEAVSTPLRGSR